MYVHTNTDSHCWCFACRPAPQLALQRVLIEEGKKAAAEGRLAAALRKYETAMVTLPEVGEREGGGERVLPRERERKTATFRQ